MNFRKWLKKRGVMFVTAAVCCSFMAGCNNEGEATPSASASPVPEATPGVSYGEMLNYETDFEKLAMPFWRTNTMYNECVTMIKRPDGKITAKMLFTPVKIVEVRDVTLKKVYTEGKDYVWNEGTNTLTWLEGSSIPFFTQYDLEGKREDGTQIPAFGTTPENFDELGRSRFGNALYCIGPFLYEKQIAVTYEYEYGAWKGPVTEYQGNLLPTTLEKLKNKDLDPRFRMVFYGDSIFTGCDSSANYPRDPKQRSFFNMLKQALEEEFDTKITLLNPSVGGMNSQWGADNAAELVAKKNPDLVVIGFGMNDGGNSAEKVAANIQSIIDTVRQTSPDCEFIIVASMVPSEPAGFLSTHVDFPEAFKAMSKEGVAFVDMFNFHKEILKVKDFSATSGNNINHPNDWLIRVYAMNLISCILDI